MSTDYYLRFLEKNNKGQRVSLLTEAPFDFQDSDEGLLPSSMENRTFKSTVDKTAIRGGMELPVMDIPSLREYLFKNSNGYDDGLNHSICVLGDPGMGKSAIILDTAKNICQTRYKGTREFIELVKLGSNEDKFTEVYENPDKYYIFIDVRMTAYEKYELKGMPFKSETKKDTMDSSFETWMAVLFLPNAAGMLFLDEINQSEAGTQTALYGLLHKDERQISGRAIANKEAWTVHGAGNLPEDGLGVEKMLAALRDRFKSVWLEIDFKNWKEWADTVKVTNKDGTQHSLIHPLIMGFLKQMKEAQSEEEFKTTFIKQGGKKEIGNNAPNPRNFVALSEFIYTQDFITNAANKRLAGEIAELTSNYETLTDGTPEKARANAQLESKKNELDKILDVTYLKDIIQDAQAKINSKWAGRFKNYVMSVNNNIKGIFKFDSDYEARNPIIQKLTYASKTTDGKSKGGTAQQVTSSMGQLRDLIQSIMRQFITNCGLGDYVTGKVPIPHPHGNEKKYKEFADSIPVSFNKDIDNEFKTLSRIYTIINTQIAENARDLAAVTYSYLANAKHNDIELFPLFKLALDKNLTPAQQQKIKDDRGKDIEFSQQQMKDAMASLQGKLSEELQAYSTGVPGSSEDEEEEGASLEEINILVQQSLKFLTKP